jgi:phage-related protein
VLELAEDHDGDTYRAVYTVKLADRVYVLHAFRKKSKNGIKTPKHVTDLVRTRLREAERIQVELEEEQ